MQSTVLLLVATCVLGVASARTLANWDRNWLRLKVPKNEVKVLFGDTVELECEAYGSPAPFIQFYRDPADLAKNDTLLNDLANFQSTPFGVETTARLRLVAKKTELISCEATNGNKSAKATIRVLVSGSKLNLHGNDLRRFKDTEEAKHKAPRITYFYSGFLDVMGNTVTLPCTVSGSDVNTTWLHQGKGPALIAEGGHEKRVSVTPFGALKIRNMRWSDMGDYICIAKNSYGKDSITTFVYPFLPPK